jgi:hypothetical protein
VALYDALARVFSEVSCSLLCDDFLLWGTSAEDLQDNLTGLFTAAKRANVSFSPKKVRIARNASFLGMWIEEGRIGADPRNVARIAILRIPKTVAELRSWLGGVGYYRSYIKDFATRTAALRELLKMTNLEAWATRHTEEFEDVNEAMRTGVVAPIDHDAPFWLTVDTAATSGTGAVLEQTDDRGRRRPIAYASKAIKYAAAMGASEAEIAGIVWALQRFAAIIEGCRKLTIRTDCRAVADYIRKPPTLSTQLQRHALRIMMFVPRPVVEFVGADGVQLADALSRLQPNEELNVLDFGDHTAYLKDGWRPARPEGRPEQTEVYMGILSWGEDTDEEPVYHAGEPEDLVDEGYEDDDRGSNQRPPRLPTYARIAEAQHADYFLRELRAYVVSDVQPSTENEAEILRAPVAPGAEELLRQLHGLPALKVLYHAAGRAHAPDDAPGGAV